MVEFSLKYRTNNTEQLGAWGLDFEPIFYTLLMPENKYKKLLNVVIDKEIPFNININGINGVGKLTLVKCIARHCFDINLSSDLRQDKVYPFVKYNTNLYYLDLINNDIELSELAEFMNKMSKYRILGGENVEYRTIIIPNIDKIKDNKIMQLISTKSENKNLRFITTTSSIIKIPKKYIGGCFNYRLTYMDKDEFKDFYTKFKRKYKMKNLKFKDVYKIYTNSNYNLKKTLIKTQVKELNTSIDINVFEKAVIKLLNLCSADSKFIEIKNLLYIINGMEYNHNDLLKKTIGFLCKNKDIKNMDKIIELTNEANINTTDKIQTIFSLENYYFKLSELL